MRIIIGRLSQEIFTLIIYRAVLILNNCGILDINGLVFKLPKNLLCPIRRKWKIGSIQFSLKKRSDKIPFVAYASQNHITSEG